MQVWSAVFDLSKCARRSERPKICPLAQMLLLACSVEHLGTNARPVLLALENMLVYCLCWCHRQLI